MSDLEEKRAEPASSIAKTPPMAEEWIEMVAANIVMIGGEGKIPELLDAVRELRPGVDLSQLLALQEGDRNVNENTPSLTSPDESTTTPLGEIGSLGHLYQDAAVWVFIAAFVGLAIAWTGGIVSPWAGALIGGGIAFVLGGLAIASRG